MSQNPVLAHQEYLQRRDERVVALYAEGLSLREAARRVGTTHSSVANDLSRLGVKKRPGGRPKKKASS